MTLRIAGTSMAIVAGPSATFADTAPDRGWDYGHMYWGVGHSMFGGIMMLAFWGIIIALIVLAVRWFSQGEQGGGKPATEALDILRARYARGEIDQDEFEKRKAVLEK